MKVRRERTESGDRERQTESHLGNDDVIARTAPDDSSGINYPRTHFLVALYLLTDGEQPGRKAESDYRWQRHQIY
jgi:hypothetical protein